jgi:hypothetical protein
MWNAAGSEWGRAMDYWIAAERHVTTMLMVPGAMAKTFNAEPSNARPLDAGPADAESLDLNAERNREPVSEHFWADEYLDAIRADAYDMWEKAGRVPGDDPLAFWLAAERQMLHRLETAAVTQLDAAEPARRNTGLRPLQPGTYETPPAPEAGNTAGTVMEPSPFRIRRLDSAQGAPIR